jgi:hypothetical protein
MRDTGMRDSSMTHDDHALARDLAEEAGRRLLELRARVFPASPTCCARRATGCRTSSDRGAGPPPPGRRGPVRGGRRRPGAGSPRAGSGSSTRSTEPGSSANRAAPTGPSTWPCGNGATPSDSGDLTAGAVALPAQGCPRSCPRSTRTDRDIEPVAVPERPGHTRRLAGLPGGLGKAPGADRATRLRGACGEPDPGTTVRSGYF